MRKYDTHADMADELMRRAVGISHEGVRGTRPPPG